MRKRSMQTGPKKREPFTGWETVYGKWLQKVALEPGIWKRASRISRGGFRYRTVRDTRWIYFVEQRWYRVYTRPLHIVKGLSLIHILVRKRDWHFRKGALSWKQRTEKDFGFLGRFYLSCILDFYFTFWFFLTGMDGKEPGNIIITWFFSVK